MDEIAKVRDRLYDALSLITDISLIKKIIPKPTYSNFFPVLSGLVERYQEDKASYEEMLELPLTEEEIEATKKEIEITDMKLRVCYGVYLEARERVEITEGLDKQKAETKNVLFATTNNGKVFLEGDLKGIPHEKYADIIDMLEELMTPKENDGQYDPTKQKKMSGNKKLKDIGELKRFGIRLYYLPLGKDALVIAAAEKKDDNPKILHEFLENRKKAVNDEYTFLKKNPEEVEKRIPEDGEIYDRIVNMLSMGTRGGN